MFATLKSGSNKVDYQRQRSLKLGNGEYVSLMAIRLVQLCF